MGARTGQWPVPRPRCFVHGHSIYPSGGPAGINSVAQRFDSVLLPAARSFWVGRRRQQQIMAVCRFTPAARAEPRLPKAGAHRTLSTRRGGCRPATRAGARCGTGSRNGSIAVKATVAPATAMVALAIDPPMPGRRWLADRKWLVVSLAGSGENDDLVFEVAKK